MDLRLNKKVVIVTGGAGLPGSIGEVTVRHIAREGGIPVIVDKSDRGQQLAKDIREKYGKATFIQADLTTEQGCQRAVKEAIDAYNRIDGVVNNLGINDNVGLGHSYQAFIDSLKLNLVHFFAVTKAALPYLKKTSGAIINITSKVALTGQGGTSGYAAAKGGVLALTREWAVEFREDDIRVNAVVIAESFTPSYETWLKKFDNPQEMKERIASKVPLGKRMTKPSEIADTILFLLSGRSSHTTGQIIHVDGGYVHLDRAIT